MDLNIINRNLFGYIPELPVVACKFVELAKVQKTARQSFTNLILSDPVLALRIFRYVNHVLNAGNSEKYLSINKGALMFGLHAFKNVVITFSLFPIFEEAGCIDLFKYSLLTGYFAKVIAAECNLVNKHDAFLLGFLHDIGRVVFKNKFADKYPIPPFGEDTITNEVTLKEEFEMCGCTHADISEYMCASWSLPAVFSDTIKCHHNPFCAKLPHVAAILYISDFLAKNSSNFDDKTMEIFQYMQMSKSSLMPVIAGWQRKLDIYFEILEI